jgi:hypothetical protein
MTGLKRVCALAAKGLGQLLTERDNRTLDIKRLAGAVALAFAMGCKAYDLVVRHGGLEFEPTCRSLAELLAALGATIAINRNTENGG